VAQSDPKVPQGVPKAPKRHPKRTPKSTQGPTRDKIKVSTFSKLGFVHRRSVFEPPKPKVDYPYYVLGTLEILILVKSDETTVNTMLIEPFKKFNYAFLGPYPDSQSIFLTVCGTSWVNEAQVLHIFATVS
jgi:hypothetical protein